MINYMSRLVLLKGNHPVKSKIYFFETSHSGLMLYAKRENNYKIENKVNLLLF